jgi:hypothetical protein
MLPNWHILLVSFNTNQWFTVGYSDTLLEATFDFGGRPNWPNLLLMPEDRARLQRFLDARSSRG